MMKEDDLIIIDDDFLSLIEQAESQALSVKRRKIEGGGGGGEESGSVAIEEGAYIAALKGNSAVLDSFNIKSTGTSVKTVAAATNNNSGNACFKCGQLGHWSRDCTSAGSAIGFGSDRERNANDGGGGGVVPEKQCPCGVGICSVLTANTEKNRGRKFFKCPVREENGGCGFFEWCDNSSTTSMSSGVQYSVSNSSFPDLPCPCGEGSCLVLTAKTGQNVGRQFYRCPADQGHSCGFFKWCSELNSPVDPRTSNSDDANNKNYSGTGSSCFKCGQEGHWARDCPAQASLTSSVGMGGYSASSGTGYKQNSNSNIPNNKNYTTTSGSSCFKCGQEGHWARDCPAQPSFPSSVGMDRISASAGAGYDRTFNSSNVSNKSYNASSGSSCFKCGQEGHWSRDCTAKPSVPSSVGMGGNSASSGTCYKCSKSGHWARDCPGQDQKFGKTSKNISSSYSSYN